LAERDQALEQRDRRTEAYDQIRFEQREAVTARGAALVMRDVARTRTTRSGASWISRLLAVIVILAVVAAIVLLVRRM
jgi:hypothetical protein